MSKMNRNLVFKEPSPAQQAEWQKGILISRPDYHP